METEPTKSVDTVTPDINEIKEPEVNVTINKEVTSASEQLTEVHLDNLDTTTHSPVTNVFSQLIQKELEEKLNEKNFVELDEKNIHIILDILKMKQGYFDDYQKLISLILEDGKINVSDLPYITSLVSLLYETISTLKQHKLRKDELIQTTLLIADHVIKVLIKHKIVDIKGIDEEKVLESFHVLINSCVNLIKLHESITGKKSCLSRLFC